MKTELAAYALAAGLLLDGIGLRLKLRREAHRREAEAEARRESVAQALGVNTVNVDGYELPVPDYEHWTMKKLRMENDGEYLFLCVGKISVRSDGIWIGANIEGLPVTVATKRYANDVWKAYRQRLINQSLKQE